MTPKMITVHCSDTPNGKNVTGDDIKKYHMAPPPQGRGWADIGYHGVVEVNGDFYRGRPDDAVGAHVKSHNVGNLGICLVGTDKFTPAQIMSLGWVIRHWKDAYGIGDDKVFAHCEWDTGRAQGKTCPNIPGTTLRLWTRTGDDSVLSPYLIGSPHVT